MTTSTYHSTNLAADSFGQDNYNYNYDYNYDHDVTKRDEVILSDVIEEIVANESLYNNNGDDDDVDKLLQQTIMGNTTIMATTTNTMCTKHEVNNNNNNNIKMSIGSTMPVDDNVYDANTLDLMREGLPSSLPNVTFDENENKVQGEEAREEVHLPSKWLTEQLGFWYDTSYSSSSSSSLSLSSHSSSFSSSSSLSHSSRSENLSTRRKKSNSKRNNFYANEDTKHKHWSEQEDKMLRFEVNKLVRPDGGNNDSSINWDEISMSQSFRRTRSIIQCKNRWYNHLQPRFRKGNWSKDEDEFIKDMVEVVGFGSWTQIVDRGLSHRHPTQIRDRYINVLDPTIKKTRNGKKLPWTEEEDRILTENQKNLGNKWTEIRKNLPGRTQLDVKNRYYNQKRRKLPRC